MIKVVFTGPESTGKTTLANQSGKHFNAPVVEEFARKHIENLGRPYRFDDLFTIAKGQLELERKMQSMQPPILICDTDLLVLKVWSEWKYGKVHPYIVNSLRSNLPNLYLLCKPDSPWQADPIRENPFQREELYEKYKIEIERLNVTLAEISGTGNARLLECIKAIEAVFQ